LLFHVIFQFKAVKIPKPWDFSTLGATWELTWGLIPRILLRILKPKAT